MQTLLLVDDEPNIVEGLASQFEGRYGGDVIVLKSFSGLHALSILQNNKVDVVLSDIRMPDMDGLTLQRETEVLWPHIHFVFLRISSLSIRRPNRRCTMGICSKWKATRWY